MMSEAREERKGKRGEKRETARLRGSSHTLTYRYLVVPFSCRFAKKQYAELHLKLEETRNAVCLYSACHSHSINLKHLLCSILHNVRDMALLVVLGNHCNVIKRHLEVSLVRFGQVWVYAHMKSIMFFDIVSIRTVLWHGRDHGQYKLSTWPKFTVGVEDVIILFVLYQCLLICQHKSSDVSLHCLVEVATTSALFQPFMLT